MSDSLSSISEIPLKDQEYRCPKCSLIPFIKITNNENKLFITTYCTNEHVYCNIFDEMQIMCKTSPISNLICENCQIENKINFFGNYNYCINCYKTFCFEHGKIHVLKNCHKIFPINKIDTICPEHNEEKVVGYCSNHNKNYCILCNHFNENECKFEEKINKDEMEKYENELKTNVTFINEIEISLKNYNIILKELEKNITLFKENIVKKIIFMREIINCYKAKEIRSEINHQMKSNIENNHFDLTQIKEKIVNKLNAHIKEINSIINLLKKNENLKQ